MLDRTRTTFSHVKPADTPWRGDGLRDFFLYRDLGVAAATNGQVIAQRVKANQAPTTGTGGLRHHRCRAGRRSPGAHALGVSGLTRRGGSPT